MEQTQEPITLTGAIESMVFQNAKNGWTVLEMSCDDELVTVVGHFPEVHVGDEIRVLGGWVSHPSYGRQFQAESFEPSLPATKAAVLKYLSAGSVKGVGPSLAKRIVERFGDDTLDVLENNPDKLAGVRGISPQKAKAIGEEYRRQFGVRRCMLFLQQYGVTPAESIRIWKKFGVNAIDQVRKNPYILCGNGLWIGFERADAIAEKMGIAQADPFRIGAGVAHVLRHNLFSGGHTYIPWDKLCDASASMLRVGRDEVETAVETLRQSGELAVETIAGRPAVFLPDVYRAETYVAGRLTLMAGLNPPPMGDCLIRIGEAQEKYHITYAEKQKEAIESACGHNLLILTGGPGTGKTTTLNAIITVYECMGLKVALAAPTGRAAQRMAEVSGREAKTIHRLLEMEYNEDDVPRFARNERNMLDCGALIVDEVSMMDILLFESLLRALPMGCRLVMVGDADQLPPVGAGNVLRDMLDSGRVPAVRLDEIFRQAAESYIVRNAHRIVRGEPPEFARREGDFFFMPRYTAAQVRATVTELVETRLPAAYGFDPATDIQVLAPGRKGELGTGSLNAALQQALNPPAEGKPQRAFGPVTFREGDKVMQIRNNYDIPWVRDDGEHGSGVFNGDIGVLETVNPHSGLMRVRFDDRMVEYPPENLEDLELAYAITVHKSQGSEFKAVVLPLFSGAPQLFYRNLLYTAVTRARELVVIVGREETVMGMVRNNKKTRRYTGLREFLEADAALAPAQE